eukprot:Hpha_TRINITY_DN27291_c0_g1::TRINITY_DN27291_c0_g1_i1::g.140703::m.140703
MPQAVAASLWCGTSAGGGWSALGLGAPPSIAGVGWGEGGAEERGVGSGGGGKWRWLRTQPTNRHSIAVMHAAVPNTANVRVTHHATPRLGWMVVTWITA